MNNIFTNEKDLPKRKNIRLRDFDYSQNGYYFITICTQNKMKILGEIVGSGFARPQIELTIQGEIVKQNIIDLPLKYNHIKIDNFVIMPNHIHFIIAIDNGIGRADPAPTIGQILGYFKYKTTKEINSKDKLWQRGYHDHIIRNEQDYKEIYEYIENNPLRWEIDKYHN